MRKFFSVFIIAAIMVWANNATSAQDNADANKPVINKQVRRPIMVTPKKPIFRITLPSNPTTGYSWFVGNYDSNFVRVKSERFIKNKSQRMGVGGTQVWTFKVKKLAFTAPHVFRIVFYYTRPWQLNDVKKRSYIVITHECNGKAKKKAGEDVNTWVC